MKRQILLLTAVLFWLAAPPLTAQQEDGYYWGIKGGVTYSTISGIRSTLISPIYPDDTYNTEEDFLPGGMGGFFFDYRFYRSALAIRLETTYSMQGGIFRYQDIKDLEYEIRLRYEYINIAPMLKVNLPGHWTYVIGGVLIGMNLREEGIEYRSNMSEIVPDLQIQASLREVIKGRSNFAATFGFGFELIDSQLHIEGRYFYGLKDVIETLANSYYFEETRNRNSFFQVSAGWSIPFD